ncbi:MAG: hypothetical protein ACE5IR_20615 [bacterium]
MKNFIPLILVVFLLALLGCGDQNSGLTSAEQDQDVMSLAKKDKDPQGPKKGGPKTCLECDSDNIICTSKKTLSNGAIVTWTSSFGGFNYAKGNPYVVTVTWSVAGGSAIFTSFTAKKKIWTPKGVDGDWDYDDGSLTVSMDPMHRAIDTEPAWQGYIGNGHFKLELLVGTVKAKMGVNVHLEEPGPDYSPRCPVD